MLIMVDSFSHYTNPFLPKKWDVVSVPTQGGVSITQAETGGRFGRGKVTFVGPTQSVSSGASSINQPQYIQRNYDGVDVIHVGLAILQTMTQGSNGARLLTFLDGATTQVGIDILPSGQIRVVRSTLPGTGIFLTSGIMSPAPTFTVLGTSTNAILSSSYDFLQVKVTHATLGEIEILRGNGDPFWTLSGVQTNISGGDNSSSVLVGGYAVRGFGAASTSVENRHLNAVISDFHLLNTAAGADANNPITFIGDRHWEPLFPLVDVTQEWTPDPAPDHFANVNTVPPDDARNNNTEGVNDVDNFEFESALGPDAATLMFSYTMYLEKNTGGSVGISGQSHSVAADGNGTEFDVPNPYAFRQSFGFTDPDTGNPWTVAGFNAASHGYERTS